MQALVADIAALETEVLTEHANTACVLHAQEFEVWEKLVESVLDLVEFLGLTFCANSVLCIRGEEGVHKTYRSS